MKDIVPFNIDEALDTVDLEFKNYEITDKALKFMNIIRLVMGDFEVPSPKFHYYMVSMLLGEIEEKQLPYSKELNATINTDPTQIGIISSRGSAKALSLDSQVQTPLGPIAMGDVVVGDKVYDRDGVVCNVIGKSKVFHKPTYKMVLADKREIIMSEDHDNIIWKRARPGYTEIVKTAKELYEEGISTYRTATKKNPKGRENKYWIPVVPPIDFPEKEFPIDPYTVGVILGDGSVAVDNGYTRITSHIDDIPNYEENIPYKLGTMTVKKEAPDVRMFGLLGMGPLIKKYIGTDRSYTKKIPMELKTGSRHQRLEVLKGLMDTDGTVYKTGYCSFTSVSIQLAEDVKELVQSLGGIAFIHKSKTDSPWGVAYSVRIKTTFSIFKLERKKKREVFRDKDRKVAIESIELVETVPTQCIAVDSPTKSFITDGWTITHNSTISTLFYPIYAAVLGRTPVTGPLSHILIMSDSARGGARDQALLMGNLLTASKFANEWFEKIRFTESEVELIRRNQGNEKLPLDKRHMLIKFKGAAGGIRSGSRNMVTKDRYAIIIGDDMIKNEKEAYSDIIMNGVSTAINSDAGNAFRGSNTQLILVNTPFHKNDPIYKLVESGGMMPLITPICKAISEDVTEEEFVGLWSNMHSYESVMKRYRRAKAIPGGLRSFNQELMLRISDEESRMVSDEMLKDMWFNRSTMMKNLDGYNLYMTTDLTASEGDGGNGQDYSGAFLWAYSHNKDWFLVDMVLKKQGITEQYNSIFNLISRWGSKYGRTVEVGVEVDGQQRLNIPALKQLMRDKNIYFTIGRQKGDSYGKEGINSRRFGSKMDRFRNIYPILQAKKMFFAEELKKSPDMVELLNELRYISFENIASKHDDGLDCLSQVALIEVQEPSANYDTGMVNEYEDRSGGIYNSYTQEEVEDSSSEVF